MSELRRTVDEIRFLLQESVIALTDHLQECASDYASGCHEVNVRLRKCEAFLNQGLRSEALHFAEIAPNLLDQVGLLDFPEIADWNEVVAMYDLDKPEPLLLDVAATLNEAYALQEPVQRLLDQHRLYALARSPLPQRLKVLRSLYEIDHSAGHWDGDIREMERVRFREIEQESRTAVSKADVDRLKILVGEVTNSPWLESVPEKLLRDLKQRGSGVARNQAREQLEYLAVQLHGAHAAMDLVGARGLRDAWKNHAKTAQLSAQEDLAQQVAPILAWIEDDDRKEAVEKSYRRAILDLEQGLDDDSLDSTDLKQLGNAVEKCGRGMSEPLKMRYRSRLNNVSFAEMRRNRLRIGAMIGGILAIVVVIGVGVYFANTAEKGRKMLAAAERFIEDNRLDEAKELLDRHAAGDLSEPVLQVKKRLSDAVQKEHDRQTELAAALDKARTFKNSVECEAALKQARELARSSEEKVAVGQLESAWIDHRDAEASKNERQFRGYLESTTGQLVELDRLALVPNSEVAIQQLSDEVTKGMSDMRALESHVATESVSQAKLLDSRFMAFQKARAEAKRKDELLADLVRLSLILPAESAVETQIAEFREGLVQFVRLFPTDGRSKGFQVAGNADVIRAVFAKQIQTAAWKRFWPADTAEVETRRQNCSQLLTDYPSTPDGEVLTAYERFLKSLLWRENGDEDSDQSVKSRIRTLFSGKLVREGHMLRTTNGTCYYLEKEKDFSGSQKANFKFLIGFNGETDQAKEVDVESLVSPKTNAPPQSKIADRVWNTVSDVKLQDWDTFLKDLSVSLVAAKDIDPFLRYFLLLRTLEFASQGNSLLARELQSYLKEMSDGEMDLSVSWMNPKDSAARGSRQLAAVLIRHAAAVEEAWKRAAVEQQKLSNDLFRESWPIGWIERDKDRRWALRSQWSADQKYLLFCASGSADGKKRYWQEVGTFEGTASKLNIAANSELAEGTLVFATRQSVRP